MVNILPGYCWRRQPLHINGAVIHWTNIPTDHPDIIPGAVEDPYNPLTVMQFLTEYNALGSERGRIMANDPSATRQWASYQFCIGRGPYHGVRQFVPTEYHAYHAGVSAWPEKGLRNLNGLTLGITLTGGPGVEFTEWQYSTLIGLCRYFALTGKDLIGHDRAARPSGRKPDPGPLFEWAFVRGELG